MCSSCDLTKHVTNDKFSCFFMTPERVRRYPSLRRTCLLFFHVRKDDRVSCFHFRDVFVRTLLELDVDVVVMK